MNTINQVLPRPFAKLPIPSHSEHSCPCATCSFSIPPPIIPMPTATNKSQRLPSIKSLDLMNDIPRPTKRICKDTQVYPPAKRHQRSISMPEGRTMNRPSMSDLLNAIDLDQRMSNFYRDEVVKNAAREQGRLLARMMTSSSPLSSPHMQRWSARRSPMARNHRRAYSHQTQLPSPPTSPIPSHRRIRYVSVDSADQVVQKHLNNCRRHQ
ncbi:hypothetical protein BC943DRAFT_349745 [Umbelopsis sp. AD052]|nr:hypothetical protein BC943DRAFT_349745 [Umbelopsis sp. AD052]